MSVDTGYEQEEYRLDSPTKLDTVWYNTVLVPGWFTKSTATHAFRG